MSSYSVAHAKEQLSKLIDEALAGESVVITRHGKPVVELRPSREASARIAKRLDISELRRRRDARPHAGEDSVAVLRRLRERIE